MGIDGKANTALGWRRALERLEHSVVLDARGDERGRHWSEIVGTEVHRLDLLRAVELQHVEAERGFHFF